MSLPAWAKMPVSGPIYPMRIGSAALTGRAGTTISKRTSAASRDQCDVIPLPSGRNTWLSKLRTRRSGVKRAGVPRRSEGGLAQVVYSIPFAVGGGFLRTGCGPGPLEPDLGNTSEGNTAGDGRTHIGAAVRVFGGKGRG